MFSTASTESAIVSEEQLVRSAKQFISAGDYIRAFEILEPAIDKYPQNDQLVYLYALATAREGSFSRAEMLLTGLVDRVKSDEYLLEEVYSLLGRIYKDRWSEKKDQESRHQLGLKSAGFYQRAYDIRESPFPGINVAFMLKMTDKHEDAQLIARGVKAKCLESNYRDDHWLLATMGEACLLLGEIDNAQRFYKSAVDIVNDRHGDLSSMKRQLKLYQQAGLAVDNILGLMVTGDIVVFVGNMIDSPDRNIPRFPAQMESAARQAIEDELDNIRPSYCYCSAACGADIIFAELMIDRGCHVNIFLPFDEVDFIAESVSFAGDRWVERFKRVIHKAGSVRYCTKENYLGDDSLYQYTNLIFEGSAILKSRQLESDVIYIAALDTSGESEVGGSSESLHRWRKSGYDIKVVDLARLRKKTGTDFTIKDQTGIPVEKENRVLPMSMRRQVMTMLFADIVGYSKLGEKEAPNFFVEFLRHVSNEIAKTENTPAFVNTWGDGLFMVFDELLDAAEFSLGLCKMLAETDWEDHGLPADLNIRIGLHTGPVFKANDPIIKKENYFGTHVNKAARIEPVAQPGSVYASEQTASILSLDANIGYVCDRLGNIQLAKNFSTEVLYRLRQIGE